MKKPNDKDYLEFTGAHCKDLWKSLTHEWRCPVCNRNKRELMKWHGNRWTIALHRHHDHRTDKFLPTFTSGRIAEYDTRIVEYETLVKNNRRFEETIICGACNYLDVRIKKLLNIIDTNFSFSVEEIKSCLDQSKIVSNAPITKQAISSLAVIKLEETYKRWRNV